MPKFTIRISVTNKSGVPVKVHIGASLIGQVNTIEYYNTSDDITAVIAAGRHEFTRYLNTDLGQIQKYDLYVVLWEGEKAIGVGKRYEQVIITGAVEKKKKKIEVKFEDFKVLAFYPVSFTG